ncbi:MULTISPECIES: adenosylcobinamide-GDP ribazoletransferase [unclassified Lentimonas]|uniref:adenosylcobinamide-GDP ribazoletransferase n=1 Tax=unclassified Lentimonas TaxID=2630993 RepID=UPI00138A523D|nr:MULTISPECIES: adenosylcobinamide-GDP ribazoletransferase [unclassified Lentimonas]
MLPALTTALRLLSVLPIPGREAKRFSDGITWFPLVGGILGWLVVGIACLLQLLAPDWPALPALGALIAGVALTRGFHLDGVADCADGFWGGFTAERRLEIMKDSHIGAFGVLALVLLLIGKFAAYQEIMANQNVLLIPLAFSASRMSIVLLAYRFQYPRQTGTAAAIVNEAKPAHFIGALILSLLLIIYSPVTGLIILATAALVALGIGYFSRNRIGGVTGDVLGASCELTELIALLIIACR